MKERNEFKSDRERALSREILLHVDIERMRAHAKHAPNGGSVEGLTWDDPRWLPVLTEEIGEVARVLCELDLENTSRSEAKQNLAKELIQCAAMSVAWAVAVMDSDYE